MRKVILSSCTLILLFLVSSCEENLDQSLLHGDWQAHEYNVGGKPKATDLSKINFNFNAKNVYTFQGGPIHREAGNYRVNGKILYSTDTLNTDRIEKAVKITLLRKDSLHMDMNNGGVEEVLKFHKIK